MADEEAVDIQPVTDEQTPEQTPPKLSVSEFAAKIKAKYPAYANLDDNELTQKMLAKYPQYKDQVDLNPEKKSPDQTLPSASPTGGQDSGIGSPNIPDFNPQNIGLGYIKKPTFQDQLTTSWQNEDARKKNMQDALHGYVASGNSDPATVLSLAKTAKQDDTSTNTNPFWFLAPKHLKEAGEYLTNHVFIPAYKSVVGGVDTLGAGAVDFLSDIVDKTTPFNVADNPVRKYFDEAAAGASNIAPIGATKGKDGAIGSFLEDLSSAGGTVAMAALTPTSTARTLAAQADALLTTTLEQAGAKSVANRVMLKAATAPITKLFAAQGAAGAYNTSSMVGGSFGENLSAGIEGGITGVGEGIKLETQMAVGNSFGTKLANKLAEKGLLVGGKPTAALINATMAGTVFGGTSAATDIANGNPIDYDAAARQAALGIAFGVPEIAGEINKSAKDNKTAKTANEDIAKVGLMTQNLQDLNHQAIINNLMGFQPEEIQTINRSKASADDLYAQSLEVGSQAYDEKDPEQKKTLQQQQLSLKNQGDVKRATETIIKNPNEFLDGVLQSDLPVENKIDLMNKATIINKGFNPIELHKQEIQNQITDLDNQVKLIDVQQISTPQDGQGKAEAFTLKDNLVQERERLTLSLLDITDKQSKGLSAAGAINTIETNRQRDLDKVGPLPHNVIENQPEGTHDVVASGDILSQHPTPQEAHQRAQDLNRPQIKAIDEINDKYNKQRAPFDAAAEAGLIEPPTGKKVTDNIPPTTVPEKIFDLNTPGGKIKVEPISENELQITTDSGKKQNYSIKEAVDNFEIKPEDIKKIADNYVAEENSLGKTTEQEGTTRSNEIPSEAAAKQDEGAIANGKTTTEGTGENATVIRNIEYNGINYEVEVHNGEVGDIKEKGGFKADLTPHSIKEISKKALEDNAAQSGPPAETINSTENGEVKTNEAKGYEEGVLKESQAQEQTPEPVKATGEELDTPLLKDSSYKLAATEIPSGKNKGKFGIFETGSGKLISNLYDSHEELISNFEKNKDKLTPDAIKTKIIARSINEGITKLQSKRPGQLNDGILGLSITAWNTTLEVVKKAIDAGFKIHEAIRAGVNHIKQNYLTKASDKEIEDAVRNILLEKPTRNEGEEHHDFAKRVGDWKNSMKGNEELSNAYKREVTKSASVESKFNDRIKSGVELLKKNIQLPTEEFNKLLGVPEGDTEHYLGAINSLIEEGSVKKINAQKIKDSLIQKDPKKYITTESSLLQRSFREREKASKEGYKFGKAETKQAFLEYDAAIKEGFKDKIESTKANYEQKLANEKQLRKGQVQKIKDTNNYVRTSLSNMLSDLNRSGLLGGVKYSDADLLSLASNINKVTTEKGIDNFKNYLNKVVSNADYAKDIQTAKENNTQLKNLLKKDYVPQNIKGAIKELSLLNPNRVEDIKEYNKIAEDLVNSQTFKEFPQNKLDDIHSYLDKQLAFDLKNRKADLLGKHEEITNSKEFADARETGNTNFIHRTTLVDMADKILGSDKLTDQEKVLELNKIQEALSTYHKGLDDASLAGEQPSSFHNILDAVNTSESTPSADNIRDDLENTASAIQDSIEPLDPDYNKEQSDALKILKEVPLAGMEANDIRLFNNVVNNVIDNADYSALDKFKIKAEANGQKGAKGLVDYIKNDKKTAVRPADIGDLNREGKSFNTLVRRIANSSTEFAAKILTHTGYHAYNEGSTKVKAEIERLFNRRLYDLVKKHNDILSDVQNDATLVQYSRIIQHRETSISENAKNKELHNNIKAINDDIRLKANATKDEQIEAEVIKESWDKFQSKIQEATGIDIYNPDDVKNLTYEDLSKIDFLTPGQKEYYDIARNAADTIRPDLERVHKQLLNKDFEGFVNYLPNSTRILNSPYTDVLQGEDGVFSYNSGDPSMLDPSSSANKRVKGNPVSEKGRVISYNFKNTTEQAFKEQLHDIYTLEHRLFFDQVMKDPALREAILPVNHDLYKQVAAYSIKNDMGLGEGLKDEWRRKISSTLSKLQQVASQKQLFTWDAVMRQYISAWSNTFRYAGLDFPVMFQMMKSVKKNEDLQKLIASQPIAQRAENYAGFNVKIAEQYADKKNTLDQKNKKGVINNAWDLEKESFKAAYNGVDNFLTKFFFWHDKNGIKSESPITESLKLGDVNAANVSWAVHYAKYLTKKGIIEKPFDVDWSKELANPNKDALAYAEHVTSVQLNENTKSGRAELIQSKDLGEQVIKNLFLAFGSFNLHKGQNMAESMRTLFSKQTRLNKDYRQNEASEAVNNILSSLFEELAYQGTKTGLKALAYYPLAKGITYGINAIFGSDEENKESQAKLDAQQDKLIKNLWPNLFNNSVGNYFFGALGNAPQTSAERFTNWLIHEGGAKDDLFIMPKTDINREIHDMSNYGYYGAAFQGTGDLAKDAYRLFDNKDKYGVEVNYTTAEKAKIVMALISESVTSAGRFDPNINRIIQNFRQQIDFDKSGQFHEPYYRDENAPRPLSISNQKVILSEEHEQFYENERETLKKQYIKAGYPANLAAQAAAENAKLNLLQKFHPENIIKEGTVIKPKKK